MANSKLVTGLSSRLLIATILFVMLAEVLIFVPSIAQFRKSWLEEKLAGAQIATLSLLATDDNMVSDELRRELLKNAGAHVVALTRDHQRRLILAVDMPPMVNADFDLRGASATTLIGDAFMALARNDNRMVLVKGEARHAAGDFIEVVIDEAPLRNAMWDYAINILTLSLVISVITASLVYVTLHRILVRPMGRITGAMLAFRDDPFAEHPLAINGRRDEVGEAERALADMQGELQEALTQKAHLTALGEAVSKINHDMRNILTSVQILSDRLGESDDPQVQRLSPKLVGALDRAVRLTENVLQYGSSEEAAPNLTRLNLHGLVEDVAATALTSASGIDYGRVTFTNATPEDFVVVADADQLFRILVNLVRNAAQALEASGQVGEVTIMADKRPGGSCIHVSDTGPGLPPKAQKYLFQPFQGSLNRGGTGLGLAIAQELAQGHKGEITLEETGPKGTRFSVHLPG